MGLGLDWTMTAYLAVAGMGRRPWVWPNMGVESNAVWVQKLNFLDGGAFGMLATEVPGEFFERRRGEYALSC